MALSFSNLRILFSTLLLTGLMGFQAFADDSHDHHGHGSHDGHNHSAQAGAEEHVDAHEKEFDAVSVIMHHIADAHDWHIMDLTGADGELHPVSIPLPIILYTEGSFDVFMSSAFHHGHSTVVKGDREYKLDSHGHITDLGGKKVVDFSITKNVATLFIAAFLLLAIFGAAGASYNKQGVPSGIGKFMEPLVLFVRDDIAVPNIGEKKAGRYMGYLLSVFFFIWIINLLGLMPTGANLTGNIAFTLTLSVFTLLITNLTANKDYWKHILMPPVPWPMWIIMIPVELVGIITKPFALMMRLFANITAGHILMLSLVSLIFMFKTALMGFVSVPFMVFMTFLELLVAALQAYIFTLLSALFIGMAVAEHDHHHEHEEEYVV